MMKAVLESNNKGASQRFLSAVSRIKRRIRHSLFASLMFIVPLIATYAVTDCMAEKPFRRSIGLILPLTGPLSSFGQGARRGAEIGMDDVLSSCACDFKIEDDQLDPKRTVSSFFALTNGAVGGIVCFGSTNCGAIADLAETRNIPVVAIASDRRLTKDRNYVFRLDISPLDEARKLAGFIQTQGYKRIVAFVAQQDGTLAGHDALKGLPEYADRQVESIEVLPTETDYRSLAKKALKVAPDAILIDLFGAPAGMLARQLRDNGFRGALLGLNFVETEESLTAANGALEGIVFTNIGVPAARFAKIYQERYGSFPTYGSAHGSDAVRLLGAALCDSLYTPSEYLRKVHDFEGALGTYSAAGNNEYNPPVFLKTVRHSNFEILPVREKATASKTAAEGSKAPIKLGATLALSGKLAYMGQREIEGMQLAVEEINREGGINGRPLELLAEDNLSDAKSAVTGITKLLSVDKIDVVLSAFTHVTQAIKDVVAKSGRVMVYESGMRTIAENNPMFFRDYYDSRDMGAAIADGVAKCGYSKAAFLGEINDSCLEYGNSFKERSASAGVKLIHEESYNAGETDFRPLLLRIRSSRPEALVLCTWRDTPLVMKQLKETGMISIRTFHFVGHNAPESDTPEMRRLYEENKSVSSWYGFVGGSKDPKQQGFIERFKARFSHDPVADSAFTYDDIHIIAEALKQCPSSDLVDEQCLASKLAETDYEGIAGRLKFNSQRVSSRDVFLVSLEKGQWSPFVPQGRDAEGR